MKAAQSVLAWLTRCERLIAVLLFAFMAAIVMADVAARELTGLGISGAPRLAVYAFIAMSLISFGLASQSAEHLRPRFVDSLFPARLETSLQRIQECLMALFCLTFAWVALGVVAETAALGEVSRSLKIPIWPMQAIFPLTFCIAAIRHGLFALYPQLKPLPPSKISAEGA
ncbi:MAG: TRAP transporter small permease subunit [Pseudomonadota bacterium]